MFHHRVTGDYTGATRDGRATQSQYSSNCLKSWSTLLQVEFSIYLLKVKYSEIDFKYSSYTALRKQFLYVTDKKQGIIITTELDAIDNIMYKSSPDVSTCAS